MREFERPEETALHQENPAFVNMVLKSVAPTCEKGCRKMN